MHTQFNDKWAVILGGSQGLGLASAKRLAQAGLNICIVHRDRKSDMPALEEELAYIGNYGVEVKTFNKDILKTETLGEVASILPKGTVKLLLHSIAKGSVKPLHAREGEKLSIEDIRITIDAMALSWLDWSSAFIDRRLFCKSARNIAFTSEGNTRVIPGYGAISAAKATLEAIMRQMAACYAPEGLTTNCIQAGVTRTRSFDKIPGSQKIAAIAEKRNPFGRITNPEDVANAVYLLCTEEASWINGTVIKVDGGESLQ